MAASAREKILLLSTGKNKEGKDTKFFYTVYVNKRNIEMKSPKKKLEIKKFDPRAFNSTTGKTGAHVIFIQKKIPK